MNHAVGSDARARDGEPPSIAVLVPCYNEALTVERVVADFARELPAATIWVFDNNSTDGTAALAAKAGAVVVPEKRQGKGYVVMSMFAKVEADIYVMVDGDATYPAAKVHELLAPILSHDADQVVGARRAEDAKKAYRPMHGLGNWLVTFLVNRIFGTQLEDVMSGYRAFTRDVALHTPLLAGGFDVETEFTLQTLEKGFVIREVPVPYLARPEGSHSKLSTYRDGFRVLRRVATILKDFRPMAFFGGLAAIAAGLSLLCGYPPIMEFIHEKYVHRVPLAVLAGFLGVVAIGLAQTGVVLTTLNARIREIQSLDRRRDRRAEARENPHRP